MILSETPACYAHAQYVLMLHVGPGNLRLFGTFVPIRTPSGTLVQIRIRLRSFRLSTFPFVLFRHASIRRLCLFLVVCSFQFCSNNLRLPTRFVLFFESTRQGSTSPMSSPSPSEPATTAGRALAPAALRAASLVSGRVFRVSA